MNSRYAHDFAVLVKLSAFLCAMLAVSLAANVRDTWILTLALLAWLSFQRQWGQILMWIIFYGILTLLLVLGLRYNIHIKFISEFYIFIFWWLTPVFIVSWDIMTTPPGNLIAFFSRLKAPSGIILGILVIFRFFPTMKTTFRGLKESMNNRLLLRPVNMIRHPLASFEYILIPVLFRFLQIADQLSVSAVSRGIEAPVKRESYYQQNMKGRDYICIIAAVLLTLLFLLHRGGA